MTYHARLKRRVATIKIVAIYSLFGFAWIYGSDTVLGWLVHDAEVMVKIAVVKGFLFIICTATLLYFLINRFVKHLVAAENSQIESLKNYQTIFNATNEAIFIHDAQSGKIVDVNDRMLEMFGYKQDEAMKVEIGDLSSGTSPNSQAEAVQKIRKAMVEGPQVFEWLARRKTGELFWTEVSLNGVTTDGHGRIIAVVREISERKQAEDVQKKHIHFLENMELVDQSIRRETDVEKMLDNVVKTVFSIFNCDRAWLFYPCDPEAPSFRVSVEIYRPEYPGANTLNQEIPMVPEVAQDLRDILDSENPLTYTQGQERPVNKLTAEQFGVQSQMAFAIHPQIGKPWAFGMHQCSHPRIWTGDEKALFKEIGRRVAYGLSNVLFLQNLRESEAKFRNLFDNTEIAMFRSRLDGFEILDCNKKFLDIIGKTREEVLGDPSAILWTDPEDREEMLQRLLVDGSVSEFEFTIFNNQKGVRNCLASLRLYREESILEGSIADITERKRAEEENIKLEAQLQQAHKMEAIGQLAGGVAHDFNNMLGVILGHTEMAMEELDPALPIYKDLVQIQIAGKRSADITRQLLAFARKQTIAPKVIDLNETVESILKMLRRLIGEDIDLSWLPNTRLWPIKMDPSQIDQILANLCVNARGAITGVGKIIVETDNSTFDEEYCNTHAGYIPGEYVRLSVSDNGCGMSKETMVHIFEPFFTTKSVGEGTGLGLATVYGSVKQNNGFINVYSEPGQGTTLTICLPKHHGENGHSRPEGVVKPAIGGKETIMLVEDESSILLMTKTMLQRLGYQVLASASPDQAIQMAREFPENIDLLITDVVMPEMNGRDLAERILADKSHLQCLFMSGYTADIITKQGVIDEKVCFIQKPFSKTELAVKIREVLEKRS